MKKNDLLLNVVITVLLAAVVVVVIVKFVITGKNSDLFNIDALESITVYDLNKNPLKFSDLLAKDKETYCLLFEWTSCYSCIVNGIEDLEKLKESGSHCMAIAVHDLVYDINGWSKHQDFSPFFVLKKIDYYKNIRSATLPVIFTIKNGKVENFRFIEP